MFKMPEGPLQRSGEVRVGLEMMLLSLTNTVAYLGRDVREQVPGTPEWRELEIVVRVLTRKIDQISEELKIKG